MTLKELRMHIDDIDEAIIRLLKKRNDLSLEIGEAKKEFAVPVTDDKREREIMRKVKKLSRENKLDVEFVIALYRAIIKNSKKQQKKA